MRQNEHASISGNLTKSYLMLFPFFLVLLLLAIYGGGMISKAWVEPSLPFNPHIAEKLIRSAKDEIDVSDVVEHGGGAAIVASDGHVDQLGGRTLFQEEKLTMTQWTEFLTESSDSSGNYAYSVAYQEEKGFWLVIGYPVSIQFQFIFSYNTESQQYGKALAFYFTIAAGLFMLLFLGTWCYARYSSNTYIAPLRRLCRMVKQIAEGNYESESRETFTGEFLWLHKDIALLSEQLREEKKRRELLEQGKKQLLLAISHDLRNPLATVMGYAETLSVDLLLDEEKRSRYAEVIFRNSIRANALMNDLFTFSKLEQSDFSPEFEQGDFNEFLREQASLFFADFETAGMEAEFEIPESELIMKFDGKLLGRAFGNLFENSIRYNSPGIKFVLSLTINDTTVEIIVKDNGVGMDASVAETIFEPFARADVARNSNSGGSGLGLAIASKIIAAHHGSIELVTALGKGCQFLIKLET